MDLIFTSVSRPGFTGTVWKVTREDNGEAIAEVVERLISEPKYLVRLLGGVERKCDTRDQVMEILEARSGS